MVRVNCQNGDGGGSWVGEFEQTLTTHTALIKGVEFHPLN